MTRRFRKDPRRDLNNSHVHAYIESVTDAAFAAMYAGDDAFAEALWAVRLELADEESCRDIEARFAGWHQIGRQEWMLGLGGAA